MIYDKLDFIFTLLFYIRNIIYAYLEKQNQTNLYRKTGQSLFIYLFFIIEISRRVPRINVL